MKKILLTGASGFIGRNLAENLKNDYQLYCPLSRELNLLDGNAVRDYLKQHHFDIVIHSANRNGTRKQTTPYDSLDGNLRMFFNLERCNDLYGKMLYFGSGAEYDREHYIPDMREEYFDSYIPKDAYGFSKYIMAKTLGYNMTRQTCVSDNIYELCLFGVYGKYEEWEHRFISNAICRALKGKDITVRQNVYFDYLWIDDLIRIVRWFIERDPQYRRYNVCRRQKVDLYSLALMVRKILDVDCDIVVAVPGWKPEYTGDNSRFLKEAGLFEFTTFEDSITSLSDYYRNNLDKIDEAKLL